MEYVDVVFGEGHEFLKPEPYHEYLSSYCEMFVKSQMPWGFYPMLLYQDEETQNKCKTKLLENIAFVCKHY
jgi:hypothetical protein